MILLALDTPINNKELLLAFANFLRRTLSKIEPCSLVKDELIIKFNALLNIEDEKIQYEALWAFTNIAAGNSSNVVLIRKLKIHNKAIEILTRGNDDLKEQVITLF